MNHPGAMPPRYLSPFSRIVILFGGFYTQFGWLFFTFGAMFFWVFFAGSGGLYYVVNLNWEEVQGEIIAVRWTDEDAQELTVAYEVEGQNYQTTVSVYGELFAEKQSFPLLYQPDRPGFARRKESNDARFSLVILLILVFPLTGLGFIYVGMRNNLKSMELILNGKMAAGTFVSKATTGTRINKQPVYRYTFRFEGDDGQSHEAHGNTHQGYLVEGEAVERILYAPGDPAYAQIYDLIPFAPVMREDGTLEPVSLWRGTVLILPLIAALMFGWLLF